MVKTKNSDNIKKLEMIKEKAKKLNRFNVVAKIDLRLDSCYKKAKGTSLKKWI